MRSILVLAAVCVASVTSASADTVTQTFSHTIVDDGWNYMWNTRDRAFHSSSSQALGVARKEITVDLMSKCRKTITNYELETCELQSDDLYVTYRNGRMDYGNIAGTMVVARSRKDVKLIGDDHSCKFSATPEHCKNIAKCLEYYSADPAAHKDRIDFTLSLVTAYSCR